MRITRLLGAVAGTGAMVAASMLPAHAIDYNWHTFTTCEKYTATSAVKACSKFRAIRQTDGVGWWVSGFGMYTSSTEHGTGCFGWDNPATRTAFMRIRGINAQGVWQNPLVDRRSPDLSPTNDCSWWYAFPVADLEVGTQSVEYEYDFTARPDLSGDSPADLGLSASPAGLFCYNYEDSDNQSDSCTSVQGKARR